MSEIDSSSNAPKDAEAPEQVLLSTINDMQAQLDALREQLTESQRLATIGTISAVIAHEFNNLLTPVISYSQYALQSAEGDKPDIELMKKALAKSYQGASKAGGSVRPCSAWLAANPRSATSKYKNSSTKRCSSSQETRKRTESRSACR